MATLNTPSGAEKAEPMVIATPGGDELKAQMFTPLCAERVTAPVITPPDAGGVTALVIAPVGACRTEAEAPVPVVI